MVDIIRGFCVFLLGTYDCILLKVSLAGTSLNIPVFLRCLKAFTAPTAVKVLLNAKKKFQCKLEGACFTSFFRTVENDIQRKLGIQKVRVQKAGCTLSMLLRRRREGT